MSYNYPKHLPTPTCFIITWCQQSHDSVTITAYEEVSSARLMAVLKPVQYAIVRADFLVGVQEMDVLLWNAAWWPDMRMRLSKRRIANCATLEGARQDLYKRTKHSHWFAKQAMQRADKRLRALKLEETHRLFYDDY